MELYEVYTNHLLSQFVDLKLSGHFADSPFTEPEDGLRYHCVEVDAFAPPHTAVTLTFDL